MSNVTKEALLERAFQAEAKKAQTKLKNIRKRALEAREGVAMAWAVREADYINSLPQEVRAILITAGTILANVGSL